MNVPTTSEMWRILKVKFGHEMDGYKLIQENGQRKLLRKHHPKGCFSPPEDCEVFIGRLPRDLFEDELLVPFLRIGKIFEVRLMMNFSGVTRGFAFMKYYRAEHARSAIQNLNNFEIRPAHKIGVLQSMNHRNLYIGPVLDCYPYVEREVLHFLQANTPGVEKVTLIPLVPPKQFQHQDEILYPYKNIVVLYKTHRDAAMARRILIPNKHFLLGTKVEVDWASPELLRKVYANIK